MAKPRPVRAPHWGNRGVTLGDTYECPFGVDAYKWPVEGDASRKLRQSDE